MKNDANKPAKIPNFRKSVLYTAEIELSDDERKRIVKSIEKNKEGGWDRECLSPAHLKELESIIKLRSDLEAFVSLVPSPNGPQAWLIIHRQSRQVNSLSLPIKEAKALDRLGERFGLPTQILIEKIVEYAVTLPNLGKLIQPFVEGTEPLKTAQDAPKASGRGADTSRRAKASAPRSATQGNAIRRRPEPRVVKSIVT